MNEDYGVDPLDYETFKKDFADLRLDVKDGGILTETHSDFVHRAISSGLEVPESVQADYRDMIDEIRKKQVKRKEANAKKHADRAKKTEEPTKVTQGRIEVAHSLHMAEVVGSNPTLATSHSQLSLFELRDI